MDYHVLDARYVRDYVVWLRFRDGTAGEVDLGPELWGEVFEPLKDVEYFKKFRLDPDCCTLVWPNDADIAPEFLHEAVRARASSTSATRALGTLGSFSVTQRGDSGATLAAMPEISRFLGIVIGMYHREHGVPHFHARYAGHEISVELESATVYGTFPPRALRHVREWATLHKAELLADWELARQGKPTRRIAPLE